MAKRLTTEEKVARLEAQIEAAKATEIKQAKKRIEVLNEKRKSLMQKRVDVESRLDVIDIEIASLTSVVDTNDEDDE